MLVFHCQTPHFCQSRPHSSKIFTPPRSSLLQDPHSSKILTPPRSSFLQILTPQRSSITKLQTMLVLSLSNSIKFINLVTSPPRSSIIKWQTMLVLSKLLLPSNFVPAPARSSVIEILISQNAVTLVQQDNAR